MMKKKILLIALAAVLVCAVFAGCSSAGSGKSQEAWNVNGDTATFTLNDISGSTGYTWHYAISNPEVLKYVSNEIVADENAQPGASAIAKFVFKGIAEGNTTLVFSQGQDWDENATGDQLTYQISVATNGNVTVG